MKKCLAKVIIIAIHAFILACLFFPSIRNLFKWERKNTPEPAAETSPDVVPPEIPPVLPDAPENTPEPDTTTPKPPPKTTPTNPQKPPVTPAPKSTATNPQKPPVTPTTPKSTAPSTLKPYTASHYRLGLKALPAKLAKTAEGARAGVLIDLDTHTILWERNSTQSYPIASLTKMLTSLMLLQKVRSTPGLTLDSTITVTAEDREYIKKTKNMGSGVYLDTGEKFTLREYLKCMIICSANDCAYIVGKFLGDGNLSSGIQLMNDQAKAMGLSEMKFYTPNGVPIDTNGKRIENEGSARGVAYLAECVMQEPEYMTWAGTKLDSIREGERRFDLASTNHLLRDHVPGVTGLKTGYTNTAGYCIAVSCTREKKTMLLILMGVDANTKSPDKGKHRDEIAKQLLDWAFKQNP